MIIRNTHLWTFSPCGTTKKLMCQATPYFPGHTIEKDITKQTEPFQFNFEELFVLAFPVYCGRMPTLLSERLSGLHGQNTPAIIIATYGAREYDDALLEAEDMLKEKGFTVIGAAAMITPHCIITEVAADRPTEKEYESFNAFVTSCAEKISATDSFEPITVPGNRPYKPLKTSITHPKVSDGCQKCFVCVERCPAGAISKVYPAQTDFDRCIGCMACAKYCPHHIRQIPKDETAGLKEMLLIAEKKGKTPEFFL